MYINFLWDGQAVYSIASPVAWDIVCRDKKEGGLNIQNCYLLNQAAIGKLVWNIAQKQDSLWMKWVDHVYLKGRNWKRYKASHTVSWSWKHIWKVKDLMKSSYTRDKWSHNPKGYTISNGYKWLKPSHEPVCWKDWGW